MYGEKQINEWTWGHILEKEGSGAADEIIRRKPLYLLYTDMLVQLLSLKQNISVSPQTQDTIKATMAALLQASANLSKNAKLDAIIAFEIAKLKNPNAEGIEITIPIKYFDKDSVGGGLLVIYKWKGAQTANENENIWQLTEEASSIKTVFESYMKNIDTNYKIVSIDDSDKQKIVIRLEKK
jgi:hypothetical protein